MQLKYLSRNDLETIGGRVIAAYKRLPAISGQALERVDIDFLCQELLGLRIDYARLSLNGEKIGLTSSCDIGVEVFPEDPSSTEEQYYMLDGKTILIESDLMKEGANIRICSFFTLRSAALKSISCQLCAVRGVAHSCLFICLTPFRNFSNSLAKKDQAEVCSLSGEVMFQLLSRPLQSGIRFLRRSFTSTPHRLSLRSAFRFGGGYRGLPRFPGLTLTT